MAQAGQDDLRLLILLPPPLSTGITDVRYHTWCMVYVMLGIDPGP